jgi:hypothetical protein
MNKRLRCGLWLVSLLGVAGCGDTPETMLRTSINSKAELTDRLTKVTDEPSAKKFIEHYLKNYTEKNKALNDKWEKWIKEIEDGYRQKVRVLVTSKNAPGSPEWEEEMRTADNKKDDQIIDTREAFITYMKKVTADSARFEREKARLAEVIDNLVAEEKAKGGDRPNPSEFCPNLVKIAREPDTFKNTLVTGAIKKVISTPGQ